MKPSNIVIDAVSMTLMKGCLIDFATELIGSTFRVVENPQVRMLSDYSFSVLTASRPRVAGVVVASAGN